MTISRHTSCTISARFTPTTTGARGATLLIAGTMVGSPQSVLPRRDA
jgi:hypothetical protein